MSAAEALTPTSYISHHLKFLAEPIGSGGFMTIHMDSLIVSTLLGVVGIGLIPPQGGARAIAVRSRA